MKRNDRVSAMQFVILQHDLSSMVDRGSHIDLMLETEAGLATWALEKWPPPDDGVTAVELPRHRKAYLDYEGPVSQNRGSVRRIDRGDLEVSVWNTNAVTATISGSAFVGEIVALRQPSGVWLVKFHSQRLPGSPTGAP